MNKEVEKTIKQGKAQFVQPSKGDDEPRFQSSIRVDKRLYGDSEKLRKLLTQVWLL